MVLGLVEHGVFKTTRQALLILFLHWYPALEGLSLNPVMHSFECTHPQKYMANVLYFCVWRNEWMKEMGREGRIKGRMGGLSVALCSQKGNTSS